MVSRLIRHSRRSRCRWMKCSKPLGSKASTTSRRSGWQSWRSPARSRSSRTAERLTGARELAGPGVGANGMIGKMDRPPDPLFAERRLAATYDLFEANRDDLDAYDRLVDEI